MPVQLLQDQNTAHSDLLSFFLKLYQELWRREHCDEDTARRQIYKQEEGEFPDYERSSDSMDIGDGVPNIPLCRKFLDLSQIPGALSLQFSSLQFHSTMLVRQEYEKAMRYFEQDGGNVVLSGQPGIGACLRLS